MFYENFRIERHKVFPMAYENHNAAYDLSLFDDDRYSTAAPKRRERVRTTPKTKKQAVHKDNVVEFSEENVNLARRRKHNPLKLFVGGICAAAVTFVIGAIIVGQVQLTELNQEIVSAQTQLEDVQSVYTQNEMKLEAKLSNAEIEKHATEELGMTKASNAQKEFISLESGDKAEVSVQKDDNIFTQFIESITDLWS